MKGGTSMYNVARTAAAARNDDPGALRRRCVVMRRSAASMRRLARRAQHAARRELLERGEQRVDLLVGVGGGQLHAEADLVLRDQRVGGERDVDAALEEEAADRVDLLVVAQRDLDDRQPGAVGRVDVQALEAVERLRVRRSSSSRSASPRCSLTFEAGEHGRQRGDRRRAGVEVRRGRDLQQVLDLGRAGDEGQQRAVGLGEAADEDQVVVGLAEVPDDRVALRPVRVGHRRRRARR